MRKPSKSVCTEIARHDHNRDVLHDTHLRIIGEPAIEFSECQCQCAQCSLVFDHYEADTNRICPVCKVRCYGAIPQHRAKMCVQVDVHGKPFWEPSDRKVTKVIDDADGKPQEVTYTERELTCAFMFKYKLLRPRRRLQPSLPP